MSNPPSYNHSKYRFHATATFLYFFFYKKLLCWPFIFFFCNGCLFVVFFTGVTNVCWQVQDERILFNLFFTRNWKTEIQPCWERKRFNGFSVERTLCFFLLTSNLIFFSFILVSVSFSFFFFKII